jgi:hypothetical protein
MKQIEVKVIKASKNVYTGTKIVTFEVDYPRFIHSEIMTHRMFSRNAQSSRAVPVNKTLEVNQEYIKPIVWGANESGMSSTKELDGLGKAQAESVWELSAKDSFRYSKQLSDIGLHKQWANRITEPFSRIKVVITATEFDNFFWLRDDPDAAQPEIVELARQMKKAYSEVEFRELYAGFWHLPYVEEVGFSQRFVDSDGNQLSTLDALKISASCCAQVSYRKLNDSKEKALEIYERLFSGAKPHLSPVEHQAVCISPKAENRDTNWTVGITHKDREGNYWSGNFKDFVQYRQLIAQGVFV